MDRIHIRDLALRCIIGFNDDERRNKQDVLINVTLGTDLTPAGASDNVADSVDYKKVKKKIIRLVESSSYNLIEALATGIADTCLVQPGVMEVRVTVDKPGALRFARSVAVEIFRTKG